MNNVTAAAGDVLVALARSHFGFVMSELQGHLKTMRGGACQEFVLTTLSKLASSYGMAPLASCSGLWSMTARSRDPAPP